MVLLCLELYIVPSSDWPSVVVDKHCDELQVCTRKTPEGEKRESATLASSHTVVCLV